MHLDKSLLKAIGWMGAAIVSFVVMAVCVRELSDSLHAFQMLFVRSAIGLLVLGAVLSVTGWGRLRTVRLAGHVMRNVIHFAGQTFWILGISMLPLATVAAIEFTTPIWGAGLAVLLLRERMNRGRWVALGLGFAGILVILRPGVEVIGLGAVIMLGCTFCFGATNAATKWLTRTDSALAILFYMTVMQTAFGAATSALVWTPIAPGDWPLLLLLGATGLAAHYALTSALGGADATFIMPFEFLRLPLVAVVALMLYAEPFEAPTLIGAAIIFSGTYYSLRQEARAGRRGG